MKIVTLILLFSLNKIVNYCKFCASCLSNSGGNDGDGGFLVEKCFFSNHVFLLVLMQVQLMQFVVL